MSDECPATHYADKQGPPALMPLYVPCCKCLQFNQICNSQYLGVA